MPYKKKKLRVDEDGNPLPLPPPRTSWTIEISIFVLVLATPMAIGTVHLCTVLGMLAVSLLAFGTLMLRTRRRQHPIKLFPLGVVLLGATALTALQVIPLPGWLVGVLNPEAAHLYDDVLSDTPLWGDGQWRTLSLAAPATALELFKFLAYSLAFITVANYFTERHRARRLLKMVAWSGFLVALIGFFSKLFMATEIWGFYPLPKEVFFFSTFVNPNHMAGFLLMCSPVALGLALSARGRQDRALYGFMGVIMGVGVFMSLSRGGIIAFALGMAFLVVFAATRQSLRLRHIALTQAAAAVILMVAGYLAYDTVIKEMRTIGDLDAIREDTKIKSWSGVLPMITDHPVVGIGRGAHATTYPRYKTVENCATFTHAENQTLQYLVDWGPVFGGLFVLGLAGAFLLGLRRARQSYAMGGCLAGLFAVFLHNQVDFNLESGGVMMVFVVLFALVAAVPFGRSGKPKDFETRPRLPRAVAWAILPVFLVLAALEAPFSVIHNFDTATQRLLEQQSGPPAQPCDESPLGQAACEMLDHYPSDYLAPLILGRAQLKANNPDLNQAMRWLSIAMTLNPTEPRAHLLAGRALYLSGNKDQALGEYRRAARCDAKLLTGTISEVLRLSNDDQAAIRATPDDAQSYLKTARILNTLGRKEGATQAGRLALERDSSLLEAMDLLAKLAFSQGKLPTAFDLARQAVEVDSQHDVAWAMQGQVLLKQGKEKEAEQIWREGWAQVPDSTLLPNNLVRLLLRQKKYREAEEVAERMQTFVAPDDSSQARLIMLTGQIKEARLMYFEARQMYRQAIEIQPNNLHHLFRLGRMEEKVGAWDEAQRIYKKLQSSHYRTKEMVKRLDAVEKARKAELDQAKWDSLVKEPAK